jgi:hypothetical protein
VESDQWHRVLPGATFILRVDPSNEGGVTIVPTSRIL